MRQKQALNVMMSGANVFLTGAPGAGKTYVLREFVQRTAKLGKRVAVTASTGIAATHIGGTTIHSWSGLGIRSELSPDDVRWLKSNDRLMKRYNSTDILVIDEISMLHGHLLDMINQTAKLLRKDQAAFGGLQVVLVGDLFQLPPISRGNETVDFVHESSAWTELNVQICYLTEQHRQEKNDNLLELLEAMRNGEIETMHTELIQNRLGKQPHDNEQVTRLYTHNIDVEAINQQHLARLETESKVFYMQSKGSKARREQLMKSVLAPEVLVLKINAEIMFVANNFSEGYVNGSRGRVVSFEDDVPVVRLLNGRLIKVMMHSWSLTEDDRVQAEVIQLPLRLAWAITIHKSQGMSLDSAEIDLSRAFTPGMGYVALSRVRSLDGLYLQGINRLALVMHPQIFEYDSRLRIASSALALQTADITDDDIVDSAVSLPDLDTQLLNKLKDWRLERAKSDRVPPFMIAHNSTLAALAASSPANSQQLLAIPGLGSRKISTFGADILSIIAAHKEAL
jgi:ATP-dependent exoDNAse (exonuclease V) alpha subunit